MNLYIVTGTSKGIGHALMQAIHADKDNELICLNRSGAAAVPGAVIHAVDLSDPFAIDAVFADVAKSLDGRAFDKAVLINNAGVVVPVGPLARNATADIVANINVNLVAPMVLMRCFLGATEGRAKLRRVINISSGAGKRPIAGWSAYCAAKAGLDMVTRVAALEAETHGTGVEIVSLAPGVVDTPMQAVVRSSGPAEFPDVEQFRKMSAEGVLRSPDAVAAEILRFEREGRLTPGGVLDLRTLAA
jgi:benzil reductase ((S)-benzoin forming)